MVPTNKAVHSNNKTETKASLIIWFVVIMWQTMKSKQCK